MGVYGDGSDPDCGCGGGGSLSTRCTTTELLFVKLM